MRKLFFILILGYSMSVIAQKTEVGIVYSPLLVSKITFDKSYVIFHDYSSLTAGDNKFYAYPTVLSTGVFIRHRLRNLYFQGELNFFENKFRKNIPDWKSLDGRYFTYSALEVPLFCGYTINPGDVLKLRVFGGLNNRIGRFRTVFFSTLSYAFKNTSDYYFADKERKKELMNKFSNYYIDAIGGIGFTYYQNSFDIRIEKNMTDLNREKSDYNANYKDLFMIRLCCTFTLRNLLKKTSTNE